MPKRLYLILKVAFEEDNRGVEDYNKSGTLEAWVA